MSKRPNLTSGFQKPGNAPKSAPEPSTQPVAPAPEPDEEIVTPARIQVYLHPDARRELKMISAETGAKVNDLLIEAINDLLKKRGKPACAEYKTK